MKICEMIKEIRMEILMTKLDRLLTKKINLENGQGCIFHRLDEETYNKCMELLEKRIALIKVELSKNGYKV